MKTSTAKKIAPVVLAPKPELTPEEKRTIDRDRAFYYVGNALESAQETILKLQASIAAHGIVYALDWNGEEAMTAEHVMKGAWSLLRHMVLSDDSDDVKAARYRDMAAQIVTELVGDGWGGGSGPWNHRSTSAMSNINAMCECNAKRQLRALYVATADRLAGVAS